MVNCKVATVSQEDGETDTGVKFNVYICVVFHWSFPALGIVLYGRRDPRSTLEHQSLEARWTPAWRQSTVIKLSTSHRLS